MQPITVLEQRDGKAMRAAWGEWNSPHDALEGPMSDAWLNVDSKDGFPGDLKAGEWDVIDGDDIKPEIAYRLEKAYTETRQRVKGGK